MAVQFIVHCQQGVSASTPVLSQHVFWPCHPVAYSQAHLKWSVQGAWFVSCPCRFASEGHP